MYSPICLFTSSSETTTPTFWPAVPDSLTSCFAFSISGAVQLVAGDSTEPPAVYWQKSLCPGNPGGKNVHAGDASCSPPKIFTIALRSSA